MMAALEVFDARALPASVLVPDKVRGSGMAKVEGQAPVQRHRARNFESSRAFPILPLTLLALNFPLPHRFIQYYDFTTAFNVYTVPS